MTTTQCDVCVINDGPRLFDIVNSIGKSQIANHVFAFFEGLYIKHRKDIYYIQLGRLK
jgi:hypothetical protein